MRGLMDVIEHFVGLVGVDKACANQGTQSEKSSDDGDEHCIEAGGG
jgi:hypothetical protein